MLLNKWTLPLIEVCPPWFRCHSIARGPLFYNRGRIGRFNAPNGEYGIIYLGTDEFCAFIETFGQSMQRNNRGVSLVSERDLARKCLCQVEATPDQGPFRLVDLTGEGLSQLQADSRLTTLTDDRGLPQRWAFALYQHPQRPDGLYYRVRHDPNRFGVALFDRVGDVLVANCRSNMLTQGEALAALLRTYEFALSTDDATPHR